MRLSINADGRNAETVRVLADYLGWLESVSALTTHKLEISMCSDDNGNRGYAVILVPLNSDAESNDSQDTTSVQEIGNADEQANTSEE